MAFPTQGGAFQLGVNIPVANNDFKEVNRILFFKATVTSGAALVLASDTSATDIDATVNPYVLNPSMTIILGPSTHVNNPGATEEITILTAAVVTGVTTVTATAALKYDYMAADPMTIRSLPKSWTMVTETQTTGRQVSVEEGYKFGADNKINFGVGNGSKIIRTNAGGGAGADTHKIVSPLTGINSVRTGAYSHIRNGFYYKETGVNGFSKISLKEYSSAGSLLATKSPAVLASASSWTAFSAVWTTAGMAANTSQLAVYVDIQQPSSASTNLWTTLHTIEHAQDTDDESSGYYTFDDIADKGSFDYGYILAGAKISLVNGTTTYGQPQSNTVRWFITCFFGQASDALYQNLMVMNEHQRHGNDLVLRTGIEDIPPVLIGRQTVTALKKHRADLTYRNVQYAFETTE